MFPSVGAGWVLSEENFMKAPWLNLFKVRASYGIASRADYAVNLYKDLWGTGNAFFFRNGTNAPVSSAGMKYTQLGIGDLTYEKSHKFNVGSTSRHSTSSASPSMHSTTIAPIFL
ncbi:hypothetical protein I6E49_14010 [Prevotella stercorea]|uniref:hypothetical protein n=1 Tax=Leyella stercorea TaxID=363265 RepID=UPI001F38E5FD|nr:hypothetical protein [Leyella stercorea]MCF2646382.1 hypothetical protein [Leyella stercorea]